MYSLNFEIQKSLNMKKHLLKTSFFLLLMVVGWACRKDVVNTEGRFVKKVLSDKSPDLIKRLEQLKKAFYENELDKKLIPNIDQKLVWEPDWKHPKVQTVNDSTSYVFFKLLAYVKQDGKLMEAKEVDAASYLMVKNEQDFYKAFYRPEVTTAEAKELNMSAFSGKLLLTNLKSSENYLLKYVNGKRDETLLQSQLSITKQANGSQTPSVSSWEERCRNEMKWCTYVTASYLCGGQLIIEYSENCRWPSYCQNAVWILTDYDMVDVCEYVWFPDPPSPPDQGGGSGSDNGGQKAGGDEEPASYNWRNKLTSTNWSTYLNQEPPHTIRNGVGVEIPNPESFNCHYYTFYEIDPSALIESDAYNGWPKIFNNVLLQNWQKVTNNIKVGDVVLYFREGINGPNTLSHSGRVVGVDAQGNATLISSKMGVYQIISHHPRDIPVSYGSNEATYIANGTTYPSRIYFRKK